MHLMATNHLKLGFTALVIAGAATTLVIQRQSQVGLREENESLRQQIAQLQSDLESLSNQTAQANSAQRISKEQLSELLKLRGAVGMLRQQTNEVGKLRGENRQLRTQLAGHANLPGAESPLPAAAPASGAAPFQLRLVLDEANENAEPMTNNVKAADGNTAPETLYVQKAPLMDYTAISSANVLTDPSSGAPQIEILLTDQGREQFAKITKENLNKRIAIAIDGRSYSAPVVREEITGGKVRISGSFTEEQARELAAKINAAISVK